MKIDAFDINDQDGAGEFAADRKALHQVRIDRDRSAAVHAQRFANAGNEKQERNARIAHDVPEAVDAIVSRPIGIASVLSSGTRTNPRASPFGEQSRPSGPEVAMATNGAASISLRYPSLIWSISLMTEASFSP